MEEECANSMLCSIYSTLDILEDEVKNVIIDWQRSVLSSEHECCDICRIIHNTLRIKLCLVSAT